MNFNSLIINLDLYLVMFTVQKMSIINIADCYKKIYWETHKTKTN